ncbi:MAG: response regulator [Bacteroidales bacterium]
MNPVIKIIIADNYSDGYQEACQALTLAGLNFSSQRVDSAQELQKALNNFDPDAVISNHHMQDFNAMDALKLCKQHNPDLPFIILTGSENEDAAVECMKKGASDYVLKENLTRLGFAVTHATRLQSALREKQQAQNQLHQLSTVIQQLPLAVVITDTKEIIEYVNPFASKLTGYSSEELLGAHTGIFRSGLTAQSTYKEIEDTLRAGGKWQGRLLNRKKNGDLQWESVSVSAVRDEHGMITHFAMIKEDITTKIHAEALEQELMVVKKAAEFKQNFLADMSHELRTPITGIIGMTEILSGTKLNEQQTDYLDTLKLSSENLREIINQVLDYSKIEAGKLQLRKKNFPTNSLLKNARKVFRSICQKDLYFETFMDEELPRYLEADEPRISQVINNFLSNAVKYTTTGGITIRVQLGKKLTEDLVLISVGVHDTGTGIPEPLLENLFRPFSQIGQDNLRQIEGTGLGLAICKELAQMMGGSIGVESTPGQGSNFWFTFRARVVPHEVLPAAPVMNTEKSHDPLSILVVDDKLINQKVITLMLSSLGHKTTCAFNGRLALEVFKSGVFDLILMDIQMPEMDGITCTKNLRASYSNLPPIVGISANAFEGDREKYMSQGLDEYLTKPVQTHELQALLNNLTLTGHLSL